MSGSRYALGGGTGRYGVGWGRIGREDARGRET